MPKESTPDLPLSEAGTYTLILRVSKPIDVTVGALGVQHFPAGLYSYTGSALGVAQNLRTRVARHLRQTKRRRWHIDHILGQARVLIVVYCVDGRRLECSVAQALGRTTGAKAAVRGFGSSDCSRGCPSHLHFYPRQSMAGLVRSIDRVYRGLGCGAVTLRLGRGDAATL